MIRQHTHARRLAAAAVTVVLAATGGALTALPATAAPLAAQDERGTSVPYPKGYAEPLGGGTAGFFTRIQYDVSWTSYATGATKKLPVAPGQAYGVGASDVLVVAGDGATSLTEARKLTVHDVASGAQPYTVDLDALARDGEQYLYRGAVGATLVVAVKKADGAVEGRLVTAGADGTEQRPVTGLPADHRGFRVEHTTADSAVLVVVAGPQEAVRYTRSVLDVPSGAVTDDFPRANAYNSPPVSVSATHAAWPDPADPTHVSVAARGTGGTGTVRRTEVTTSSPYALLGGWLVHGSTTRPGTAGSGSPLRAERADGTGEPVRVLDTMGWLVPGPDGSLLARGGSVEHGEGLYRITLGPGGLPVAALVAATGEPTVLVYDGADVPATIDLDRAKGADFRWRLAGRTSTTRVTITRTDAPGHEEPVVIRDLGPMGSDAIGFRWNGEDFGTPGRPAEAGTYSWEFEASQFNGLGDEVRATGTFTVRRTPGPHDFDGNGAPELLVRESGGRAKAVDLVFDRAAGAPAGPRTAVFGSDWRAFDRLETVGDVAGTRLADVVARDTTGVLWLYQGGGDLAQPLRPRVRVGAGWNAYDKLAGGSDLTGDGRADLVATDKAGDLWLYPGTGNAGAPFSARKRIGGGWGIYNQITATGNIGGAGGGDLVARDKAGVLWLYLAKGDGTFAARTRIGAGWGGFQELVGIGDADGDGRADLLAGDGHLVTYYRGTGDWKAPFAAGRRTDLTVGSDTLF